MTKLTQPEIISYGMLFKQTSVEPLELYSKDRAIVYLNLGKKITRLTMSVVYQY